MQDTKNLCRLRGPAEVVIILCGFVTTRGTFYIKHFIVYIKINVKTLDFSVNFFYE